MINPDAHNIATALHQALKDGLLAKISIDEIRAAVIGYLAGEFPSRSDTERLIETTVHEVVELVG